MISITNRAGSSCVMSLPLTRETRLQILASAQSKVERCGDWLSVAPVEMAPSLNTASDLSDCRGLGFRRGSGFLSVRCRPTCIREVCQCNKLACRLPRCKFPWFLAAAKVNAGDFTRPWLTDRSRHESGSTVLLLLVVYDW